MMLLLINCDCEGRASSCYSTKKQRADEVDDDTENDGVLHGLFDRGTLQLLTWRTEVFF